VTEKDYSATPLAKKLGVKEGSTIALVGAPPGFRRALGPLPLGVDIIETVRAPLDVIVFFTTHRAVLERRFRTLAKALDPAGGLWVAYPKKAARLETDLTFEEVQRVGLKGGLVDNKSCAIDEVWTAVRFVRRLKDRPSPSKKR
jgi:hypothetical protein